MSDAEELPLLTEAARYLFGSVLLVREADLCAPTPCQDWDLRRLLRHLRTSLADVTDVRDVAVDEGYQRDARRQHDAAVGVQAVLDL